MPAHTHTCPTCKRPLEERDQKILDLVQDPALYTYEQIGQMFTPSISKDTVQRVAARYGLSRPKGRPWPANEKKPQK